MISESLNTIIEIPVNGVNLEGEIIVPENASGLVVFSHGSGSSRLSPRNRYVAERLNERGFGTFLFDLLTPVEDEDYEKRFDINLLTMRLIEVVKWISTVPEISNLNVGLFGASTGAASALSASVAAPAIKAVVSRGGRPDLVLRELAKVKAAVRLIVGSLDDVVIGFNKKAFDALSSAKDKDLVIVEGASHLFEEPGKLDEVAVLASGWFKKYL
jgi:dienelactone hydrolase